MRLYSIKTVLLILLLAALSNSNGYAQIFVEKGVRPIYNRKLKQIDNFWEMENFGDVFNSRKMWLGRDIFSGNVSYNFGRIVLKNEPRQIEYKHVIQLYTRIHIVEEFSFNFSLYKNLNPRAIAPWTPDFSYSIGRFNWRSKTFSYGYKNYENNKYSDNISTLGEKFLLGSFFVSYIYDIPDKAINSIRIDGTTKLKFDFSANYAPKYRDEKEIAHGTFFAGKPWLTAALRYTILRNIYVESAVNYFIDSSKRQPWDPDYVYGFGYFDYRAFRLSATYGNWVVNRFPWNKQTYNEDYGFLDGEFRIIANYSW